MGIDLATWRARIGLNYYHMCHPLQTRWRSSGGRLYQPGVASWGVGQVMNDTPLVLKSCMTVVALSLILQYVVHSWFKLMGKGGGGKVRCHWRGSISNLRGAVDGGRTLLLRAIVVMIPLLLVIAGDVETNPGPEELCLGALLNQLHSVRASWYNIGLQLGIPYHTLDCFKQMYFDPSDLMREMLKHWLQTAVKPHPSWEAVVAALKSHCVDKLLVAEQLESKYCTLLQPVMHENKNPTTAEKSKDSSAEDHDQTSTEKRRSSSCYMPDSESHAQHIVSANTREGFEPVCKSSQRDTDTEPAGSSTSPLPSKESLKPPFGCWCARCMVFGFTEKGYPMPIPSAGGLTIKQKQELDGKLRIESKRIMIQFQKLVSATIESLVRQNITLDKLFCNVMTLGSLKPVFEEPQVPALYHRFIELKAVDTIAKFFLVLNDYFSFFNYHIIEHIIEELGTEEDKAKLQSYKDDFNQYAKQRVHKFMPEFGPLSDSDHAEIFVKLDSQYDNYTVAEIEEFRHKLCDILNISECILRLCRIDEGCFQLMFQVPSSVQERIFPLSRGQEEALAYMGVIRLTCRNNHFQKSEPSKEGVEKKHHHDPDDDSGKGSSIFTDTKSTTFSEDRLDKELKELDHELKVQGLVETASSHKSGSGLELSFVVAMGHLESVRFLVEKKNYNPMQGDPSGFPSFHLAAVKGNVEIFKYFVTQCNCNPACPGPLGLTPLHLAAAEGHMDIVKFLTVEKHCDPMCRDSDQHTPLHVAAKNNQIEVVKFLTLEMHCDPTSRDSSNDTAVHLAVMNGHLDIVRFFISNQKCDPNISGGYGRNLLHCAAEFGHLHIVKYLIDKQGCNPSCLDGKKLTPLHCAAVNGHMDISKFLVAEKHCDPMCRSLNENTPLHMAAGNGHKEIVKFLTLEMHCDPTSRNSDNQTAVHLAAMNGHLDLVEFFISDQKCDQNIPGQYGRTLLHCAAVFGHLHIVKYLTDKQDCNPSCLDENKFTPLHSAAKMGYMDIMKFLIVEKHCDPMCRNFAQITPLHVAARLGHIHIVKFLTLEMHCDPMCRDIGQYTPLHWAADDGHIDVVKFFTLEMHCDPTSRNANNDTALHLAVEKRHLDIVQFFISDLNCDPNSLGGQFDRTPLHYAAQCGHLHIVKYLTEELGCNPSCLDKHKNTPLYLAAAKGHTNIVKFLTINKCCNPCLQDTFGSTVLHGAVLGGHLEVVKFLVQELKCPPDIAGPFYITPLQLAIRMNHSDIAQYLKKHSVMPYFYTAIAMMKQLGLQK